MVTIFQYCSLGIIKGLFLAAFLYKIYLFFWIMYLFQYEYELCDTWELNKCISFAKSDGKGMPNQGSHSVDDTLEEIKRQGTIAVGIWIELSSGVFNQEKSPSYKMWLEFLCC